MNHNTLVIEIKSTLDKLIAARTSLVWITLDKRGSDSCIQYYQSFVHRYCCPLWNQLVLCRKKHPQYCQCNLDLRKQDYSRNDFQQNLYWQKTNKQGIFWVFIWFHFSVTGKHINSIRRNYIVNTLSCL